MKYNPAIHHRRSIRLKGYDYSLAGAYFITICAYQRECLFGEIVGGEMCLNEFGQIVAETYLWLSEQYSFIDLDQWIIMPNHLHGICVLTDRPCKGVSRNVSTITDTSTKCQSLGRLIGAFKTVSTKHNNLIGDMSDIPVWQRHYYDHIIRNAESLNTLREYIVNNPLRWELDQLHPDNPSQW